jgi:hypothetical protein
VQQYYAEGFLACGEACVEQGFAPSASLVKATLINSAVGLMGQSYFDGALNKMVTLNPQDSHQFVTGAVLDRRETVYYIEISKLLLLFLLLLLLLLLF